MPKTIGQLVDALREACLRDLGVEVQVKLAAFNAPGHEKAEEVAIIMAQELRGKMSGVNHSRLYEELRWYDVTVDDPRIYDFAVYWDEKEKPPVQAAVVNG